QSRCLASILGCEKRLKNLGLHLASHPGSGIRYRQANELARLDVLITPRMSVVHLNSQRADGKCAPLGHRIPGVSDQVLQDLVDQSRVSHNRRQIKPVSLPHYDLVSSHTPHRSYVLLQKFVEIE